MTHDAFWLSIGSDHRAENAVQLEVRRNLGGSQACGGCPCLRSIPCWPRSRLAFAWGLTRFGCPTHFLLPGRHPELASPPACSEHAGLLRRKRQPIDRFICAWAGCDDPAFLCHCPSNKKPRLTTGQRLLRLIMRAGAGWHQFWDSIPKQLIQEQAIHSQTDQHLNSD